MPLISVLIASYNYGRYIAQAIDGVLNQTYPNVEVVITDNGSTDDTLAVIASRYEDEPRVRFFQNERNLGIVGNFNRALAHARGEFVLFLSADDWFLPEHLARLYDVLRANPQVDIVYSGIYFCDAEGHLFAIKDQPNMLPFDYVDLRDELPEMLTGVPQLCLPSTLFRRALFGELGPMDETLAISADWELAVRCALAGKRFAFLVEPSTMVRVHGANASGFEFNDAGHIALETLTIFEKRIDEALPRLRGRERRVLLHLESMYDDNRKRYSASAITADVEERFAVIRRKLLAAAENYQPAQVRQATIGIVLNAVGPPVATFRALDSVAAQTHPNWQLVVLDQGLVPLHHVLRDHPAWDRIAYVRYAGRQAPGSARNRGVQIARGEYLAFLDDDGVWLPDHLASLVATIERDGVDVAVAGSRLIVEEANPTFTRFTQLRSTEGIFRGPGDPASLVAFANALPLNAILHHRRFFELAGEFHARAALLEDFDYLSRLQSVAELGFTGEVTYEAHVRLRLALQPLRLFGPGQYLATLDALYAARTVEPALEAMRARHRRAVEAALGNLMDFAVDPDRLIELIGILAGRTVEPVAGAMV